jgi:hypothetical protein
MSDDWGRSRSDLGDEDEKDEGDLGREETGGWAEEEPTSGHFRSHWPEDEESEPADESPSGWPTPGPTWQPPDYGDTSREWRRPGDPDGYYGYRQR